MTIPKIEQEIACFLSSPQSWKAWGGGSTEIECIETHISRVFLNGTRVLKLKRHVRFPYLDFSSAGQRKLACEAEVAINRRTAPELYKGVLPITRDSGGRLHIDGPGEVVDWLVEMVQFDQSTLFEKMATDGSLDLRLMEKTAEVIADFHGRVDVSEGRGGHAGSRLIVENNHQSFVDWGGDSLDVLSIEKLRILYADKFKAVGDILDSRREAGCVRHCHGDLHLRNICLFNGQPTLFDGIEFNDDFAHIDILYDLAFLLMDLDYAGLRPLANAVLNRYFDVSGRGASDPRNFSVLPLFLSMRAGVRAHVNAAQAATLEDVETCQKRSEEAARYLDFAISYLQPQTPVLIAVGGLSGSGKSTLARALAPSFGNAPGARVVRTDVVRKRLAGCPLDMPLGADGYSPKMNTLTYEAFYSEIEKCLAEGQSVIADGVFARPHERSRVAYIADEMEVAFHGLWLDVPEDVMTKRVTSRVGGPSDADAKIVLQQLEYDLGPLNWHKIDGSGEARQTLEIAQRIVQIKNET